MSFILLVSEGKTESQQLMLTLILQRNDSYMQMCVLCWTARLEMWLTGYTTTTNSWLLYLWFNESIVVDSYRSKTIRIWSKVGVWVKLKNHNHSPHLPTLSTHRTPECSLSLYLFLWFPPLYDTFSMSCSFSLRLCVKKPWNTGTVFKDCANKPEETPMKCWCDDKVVLYTTSVSGVLMSSDFFQQVKLCLTVQISLIWSGL